ncbi:peroxidase [Aestuariicoccus sp. MJ-SS9]|uniref:Dyp-type peroxidase n=1 Tax=Aestuariicoccus sp. MJ-SS9 TaxID=3079855 RepID=UPI0029127567|nr:peroxidase [Aestuariicoccus sp. MJ-SS9]MDU8910754.1 peroxidase [Aestuariicoccus sp. MJ-SS9]
MTRELNLTDIQGNVTRAYGRYSFPFARYFFFHIEDPAAGRAFVDEVRKKVTTAARWGEDLPRPDCTTNIAFTFMGLWMLELPVRTLQGMPDVFAEGMKARAFVLGDRDQTQTQKEAEEEDWDAKWDPLWQDNREAGSGGKNDVHLWVSLNAQLAEPFGMNPHPELEERTKWLMGLCDDKGVRLLARNGPKGDQPYQDASAVFDDLDGAVVPTPKEHFGFTDGIGNPVFEGQYPKEAEKVAVIGRGKRMGKGWEPLATGEFILGHPDESQELPPTSMPPEFMHNGTFFAYRKLHENVGSFNEVLEEEAEAYAATMGVGKEQARETLMASMCGRWSDGVPMALVPTYDEWIKFGQERRFRGEGVEPLEGYKNQLTYIASPEASDFRFADDMAGLKCPGGAHLRRVNTRDYMDPLNAFGVDQKTGTQPANKNAATALNKRRRILRRGLPYGGPAWEEKTDKTEQGVIMIIMGTSLFRQFEFVQQQWIQYGLDFHQGNNTCPLLGNHDHHKRHTIPADPSTGKPTYVMSKLKTFVECRGGDYFFVPSMTALRMIAMGIVDPT